MARKLPELLEGLLDTKKLQQLLTDWQEQTVLESVAVKAAAEARAEVTPADLPAVMAQLAAGTIVGVQVRYTFDERAWCDTVMRQGKKFRLIRSDVTHPGR